MITFDALCSAMNEALPQGIGLFAATYCRNFVFESTPQFAVFEIVDTCSVFARTVMMQAPRISFTGTSSSTSLVCGPQFNRGRKTDELLAPRCCSGHRPRCCSGRRPRCCPCCSPVVVPTRPSRTAFTFVTQISILETSVDPPHDSQSV